MILVCSVVCTAFLACDGRNVLTPDSNVLDGQRVDSPIVDAGPALPFCVGGTPRGIFDGTSLQVASVKAHSLQANQFYPLVFEFDFVPLSGSSGTGPDKLFVEVFCKSKLPVSHTVHFSDPGVSVLSMERLCSFTPTCPTGTGAIVLDSKWLNGRLDVQTSSVGSLTATLCLEAKRTLYREALRVEVVQLYVPAVTIE